MSYEESRAAAEADGEWQNPVRVSDCVDCPFFNTHTQPERAPEGMCVPGGPLGRALTEEEGASDEPPPWCPLRAGAIRIVLDLGQSR